MPKIRVTFDKTGDLRYISHLDTMRMIERACRRADLPMELTQGFHPHPKISVIPATKVGMEAMGLNADISLKIAVSLGDIVKRLSAVLPPEINITGAREIRKVKIGGIRQWV